MPQRLTRSIAALCSLKTVWCAKFNNLKAKISIFIQWVWWQQVSGFGWWCVTNIFGNKIDRLQLGWWAIWDDDEDWRWWLPVGSNYHTSDGQYDDDEACGQQLLWQSSGNSLTRGGCATPCHPLAHPFSLDVALFNTTIHTTLFCQSDIE